MELSERTWNDMEELLNLCESRMNYQFVDRRLLRRCLTHSSSAETRLDSNERLEFLGDSILGLIICEHLFHAYPELREGQLTQMKSQLVSRNICARVARKLQLQELVLVGRGLTQMPESILSAVVESLIAGVYIDGGLEAARQFILTAFEDEIALCHPQETENYKSQLQELTQRDKSVTPDYVVVDERGPDHAREFCVAARIGETLYEHAWGRSKKEAEQQAARIALDCLAAALAANAVSTNFAGLNLSPVQPDSIPGSPHSPSPAPADDLLETMVSTPLPEPGDLTPGDIRLTALEPADGKSAAAESAESAQQPTTAKRPSQKDAELGT